MTRLCYPVLNIIVNGEIGAYLQVQLQEVKQVRSPVPGLGLAVRLAFAWRVFIFGNPCKL